MLSKTLISGLFVNLFKANNMKKLPGNVSNFLFLKRQVL